jgi:hypothetical protein
VNTHLVLRHVAKGCGKWWWQAVKRYRVTANWEPMWVLKKTVKDTYTNEGNQTDKLSDPQFRLTFL